MRQHVGVRPIGRDGRVVIERTMLADHRPNEHTIDDDVVVDRVVDLACAARRAWSERSERQPRHSTCSHVHSIAAGIDVSSRSNDVPNGT